jgi:hypothetical protein
LLSWLLIAAVLVIAPVVLRVWAEDDPRGGVIVYPADEDEPPDTAGHSMPVHNGLDTCLAPSRTLRHHVPVATRKPDPRSYTVRTTVADSADDEGKQECGLGNWCHAATRGDDDQWHGARTFQVYCPTCRSVIGGHLDELPDACTRLADAMGDRPRTGKAVRIPFGPREPIRLEVDALIRLCGWVLGSWHERVARVDRLTAPDMAAAVQHPAEAVEAAAEVLSPRLDALLALPPEPMGRVMFDPVAAEEWLEQIDPAEAGMVRLSGEAYLLPALSGLHAGREILELHYRARRILGEVRARPETFDGVPCRECEAMALEQAEPPSDPLVEAKHSRCAECRAEMTRVEFDHWVGMYRSWAESVPGMSCRRCGQGRHVECSWAACDCRAGGHAAKEAA